MTTLINIYIPDLILVVYHLLTPFKFLHSHIKHVIPSLRYQKVFIWFDKAMLLLIFSQICHIVCMELLSFIIHFFQLSTFVGSAWSFVFFIPATTANDLRLRRISIPNFIHYIFVLS